MSTKKEPKTRLIYRPSITKQVLQKLKLKDDEIPVTKALVNSKEEFYSQYGWVNNIQWLRKERRRIGMDVTRIAYCGSYIMLLRKV